MNYYSESINNLIDIGAAPGIPHIKYAGRTRREVVVCHFNGAKKCPVLQRVFYADRQ